MLRKALLVLSGNAATSLLTLVRGILIARLIPVEDFGIAATLMLAVAVVEMASALGLQQQIVQARDGDDPRLQAALQGFQLLRGLLSGAVLFLLAGPLADFMNVPEAAWGYRAMALLPVLNALAHFDVHRLTRGMEFRPMMLAQVVPAAASLAAAWPLARWLGDWRAMLAAILLQAVLALLLSHLVARRPYRVVLDRAQMARSLRFGWPLLVNNVLLFLVFNGDRVIVGRELGMTALGIFSMGVTLTLTPTLVLAKSAQNLFLPRLSRIDRAAPGGEERFQVMASLATGVSLASGLVFVLAVTALGGLFVRFTLGDRYAPLVPLLTLLAAQQGLRVFKAGPAVVSLARAKTGNALIANLFRVGTLPVAWMIVAAGADLRDLVLVAVAGEALGFVASLALVRRVCGLRLAALAPSVFLAALSLLVANLPGLPLWLALVLLILMLGAVILQLNGFRRRLAFLPSCASPDHLGNTDP